VPDETVGPVRGEVHFLEQTNEDTLTNFVGIGEHCLITRITDARLGSLFERRTDWYEISPKYSRHDENKLWSTRPTA
jgi:hypothetical protein